MGKPKRRSSPLTPDPQSTAAWDLVRAFLQTHRSAVEHVLTSMTATRALADAMQDWAEADRCEPPSESTRAFRVAFVGIIQTAQRKSLVLAHEADLWLADIQTRARHGLARREGVHQ